MKRIICTTLLVETSPQGLPLGAACIASAVKADVRTRGQFAVELRDFSLEDAALASRATDAEKAAYIAHALAGASDAHPDVAFCADTADAGDLAAVCFSVYVWNHGLLERAARELKRLMPAVICIAGGPEVTAAPTAFTQFDYTIAGQGEGAVPALLSELFLQADLRPKPIQGVYSLLHGSVRSSHESAAPCSAPQNAGSAVMRALPCLPQELSSPYLDGTLDPARYGGALWELARGCPFKCSYCYESKGERNIAYFPLERLEKELELFAHKQIAQVFVLDPTYNANKKRAVAMLRLIEKKAPGMFFYFEARAEFIDRELARAFSRIPCALQIGLQSADPAVLANVHRTLDKKLFTRNIGFLNDAGVTFGFDLIYGLPGDTYAGFCRSIDFAIGLYPNNVELFCLSVLPGTTLHDYAPRFGMEWQAEPPYHVLCSPTFGRSDLARAERLSAAANVFYTQGRAVAWFNSVLYVLKEKPSVFLQQFADFLDGASAARAGQGAPASIKAARSWTATEHSAQIESLQLAFIQFRFHEKHLDRYLPAAEDLIRLHAALGRCIFDGTESAFTTHYHPDDVMSEYGTDIAFFSENCGKQKCRVRVFAGKSGADWQVV